MRLPPRRFVRDVLSVAVGHYAGRVFYMARGLVAAMVLGPHLYGAWNALNLILDYGSYATAGALQGLDVRLPAAVARADEAEARRLVSGAWTSALIGGALFALAVAAALAASPALLQGVAGWTLPALMVVAALLQIALQVLGSHLRASGRFQTLALANGIQALMGCGLGIALVWRFGLAGLVTGWLAGTVVALAWVRRADPAPPVVPGALADAGALVRLGFPIFVFYAALVALRSVDRLALVRFGNLDALGLYGLGLMASGVVLSVGEAFSFVLFPRVAAAYGGHGDKERVHAEVARAQRALAVLLPIAAGLGMTSAEWILTRLLPEYRGGLLSLEILAAGALVLSCATIPSYFLLAAGRQRPLAWLGAAAAALQAAVVFAVAAIAPRPAAVALAAVLGHAAFAAVVATQAARRTEPPGRRAALLAGTFVPAVWGGGVALALATALPGPSLGIALVRVLGFALLYAPALWVFGRGIGVLALVRQWLGGGPAAAR